jgi:hydroxymethylpyrimidine pyrophosphatase-like HAD family hydrolase
MLGAAARAWVALGANLPRPPLRLILADVDGVITRGEGTAAELDVLQRLESINAEARRDPRMPAIALCTGRQAPYIELMAQMIGAFLPCIFEHGAGLFFPATFRYAFDERLGRDYAARLARLREALDEPLIQAGRAFVQPGKEATMTLYPLGDTSVDQLFDQTSTAVDQAAPGFGVARNVNGVEVRPHGVDKGAAARRLADLLEMPLSSIAGVGDSEPDLSYLCLVGFSAAPSNATPAVREAVDYVAHEAFGRGLLEIVGLVRQRNQATL